MTPLPDRLRATVALALALAACSADPAATALDAGPPDAGPRGPLTLVGHAPLPLDTAWIGMAIAGDYAYVGHRWPVSAVQIIDLHDPAAPTVVGALAPDLEITELHAVADLARLYVLSTGGRVIAYDLADPVHPVELGRVTLSTVLPHEMYLWRDPTAPTRLLGLITSVANTAPGLHVVDLSTPTAMFEAWAGFAPGLHGVALAADGARGFASTLHAGMGVFDASTITGAGPIAPTMITSGAGFVNPCTAAHVGCITHSAVEVPGRPLAVVTYENEGVPEGWMDVVDVADPVTPRIVGTWHHPRAGEPLSPDLGTFGYGPHDPTTTAHLAVVSWYRAGLMVFDLSDPAHPTPVATFEPTAIAATNQQLWGRVAFVSYPIIKDGLIYVLDGRNGLYVLRYTGPYHDELDGVRFLEGNSNRGS